MKIILYLQITILLLFILIVLNQKHHYLSSDYDTPLVSGMLVCISISIGKMIKLYKNDY